MQDDLMNRAERRRRARGSARRPANGANSAHRPTIADFKSAREMSRWHDRDLRMASDALPDDVFAELASLGVSSIARTVAHRECAICESCKECERATDPNGYWRTTMVAMTAAMMSYLLDGGSYVTTTDVFGAWQFGLLGQYDDLSTDELESVGAAAVAFCFSQMYDMGFNVVQDDRHGIVATSSGKHRSRRG